MFIGTYGAFEMQSVWQQEQISVGTELAQHLMFMFGPALLSAGSQSTTLLFLFF
jgi:hypothetical protein